MKTSKTPEFNIWLSKKLQMDSSVCLEDAFNEYIRKFDVVANEQSEEAAVKLRLIEEYNIDDMFEDDQGFLNYKQSLRRSAG